MKLHSKRVEKIDETTLETSGKDIKDVRFSKGLCEEKSSVKKYRACDADPESTDDEAT
jgi:hypothetical protein